MNYTMVTTTPEVWAVIHASHPDLVVHSSYSNPDGTCYLGNGICEMKTEYGFQGAPYPLIGCRTTWEKGENNVRVNQESRYWFCVALEE